MRRGGLGFDRVARGALLLVPLGAVLWLVAAFATLLFVEGLADRWALERTRAAIATVDSLGREVRATQRRLDRIFYWNRRNPTPNPLDRYTNP